MRIGVVPELADERETVENRLHDAPLSTASAAVYDPDLAKPECGSGSDVLLHDRRDVARREGMEVQLGADRNTNVVHAAPVDQGRV